MSNIDLLLDEENELTFALSVEGTRPATAQCRLVLESQDMSLVFESDRYDGEEVTVVLPPLKHILREGQYNMDLEVIVEDKYFKPLTMTGNFEKSLEIKAQPIIKNRKRSAGPTATISEVKVKNKNTSAARKPLLKDTKGSTRPEKNESSVRRKQKVTDAQIMKIIEALANGKLDE